ncbi:BMC domain-containing protein [Limosilactobacillus avium]|uniref:BMC domain-containing protein n=1 Tax=Limosilactobacillus avium TaxID=2991831 RepID=UPI0024BB8206|nr:BMC domain-containing protein [Limosilactobacillus avium]
MMQSLGFVECDGLSGALVAADRMLKTANVKLEGIHQNMGIDWVTVKVSGDISAVSVAVETIKETMPKVYVTSTVLGSPAKGTDKLGNTDIALFLKKKDSTKEPSVKEEPVKEAKPASAAAPAEETAEKPVTDSTPSKPAAETSDDNSVDSAAEADNGSDKNQDSQKATCNLCGDPKCPRKLGEPHKKCIHYKELKK